MSRYFNIGYGIRLCNIMDNDLKSKCCNQHVIAAKGKFFCAGVSGCGKWCETYTQKEKALQEKIDNLAEEYFDLPFPTSEDSIVLSIKDAKKFAKAFHESNKENQTKNPLTKLHKEQMEEFDRILSSESSELLMEYIENRFGLGAKYVPPEEIPPYFKNPIKSFITSHNLKQIDAIIEWADTEINYVNEQLKEEKDKETIEYITGKKNLARDLLSFLEEYKQEIKL